MAAHGFCCHPAADGLHPYAVVGPAHIGHIHKGRGGDVGNGGTVQHGLLPIREVKAPNNYGISGEDLTAYLEHEGEIVRFEVTNKALATGVSITKTGPNQINLNLRGDGRVLPLHKGGLPGGDIHGFHLRVGNVALIFQFAEIVAARSGQALNIDIPRVVAGASPALLLRSGKWMALWWTPLPPTARAASMWRWMPGTTMPWRVCVRVASSMV